VPSHSSSGEAPIVAEPGWLGRILIAVLGLSIVLAWMAIQASLVFAHAVWLAVAGQILAQAEPGRIAGQIAILRLVQAVAWLSSAGLFLVWIRRAYRTLEVLDRTGAPSSPGDVNGVAAAGPDLVRIPRTVTSLWRGSAGHRTPPRVTAWVAWWWSLCMASVILDLSVIPPGRWLLARIGFGGGLPLLVLGECVRIAAAVLTIVVVARIERHQRDRCAAWASTTGATGA
jgi:hypothetical protein